MMLVLLVLGLGAALALVTYLVIERAGSAAWPAIVARAAAWAAVLLLLLNAAFPRRAGQRPIVLLDASLSMGVAGGHWDAARDSAAQLGEVRRFGDARQTDDSLPDRGRSELGPALGAAAASDRQVIIVTDGELDDASDLPEDLVGRASVVQFPRDSVPDYALTQLTAPDRVTAGDSIRLDAEVRAVRAPAADLRIEVRDGATLLASRRVRLAAGGSVRTTIAVPTRGMPPGAHVIAVHLAGADDREPRTDTRLSVVTVTATPGVVLVASPGDWDARALYRTLTEVASLPVRGYVELVPGRYRTMGDLATVTPAVVARAAAGADLLILKGAADGYADRSRARGLWRWPSGQEGPPAIAGDWYLAPVAASPVSGAFLGLPVDSFPPATAVSPHDAPRGDWVGLTAQDRRRGAVRPVVTGGMRGTRREVRVGVDGLWRWAFRGGESEQAYRSWVAATTSWLLAAPDTARGVAHALQPTVEQGRPLLFAWTGTMPPHDVPVVWTADSVTRRDTLRFDAAGRAMVWLAPGAWRYRLADGGSGTVAVETYSDEFLPRPGQLATRLARTPAPAGQASVRDWFWLFGVAIVGLAIEWWWRRRLGLR